MVACGTSTRWELVANGTTILSNDVSIGSSSDASLEWDDACVDETGCYTFRVTPTQFLNATLDDVNLAFDFFVYLNGKAVAGGSQTTDLGSQSMEMWIGQC